MSWRFRCLLVFTAGSGMADWGKAQLDVRLTHDHDPNRQQANEERSHVTVTKVTSGPTGGRHETLSADLFLATEALAADTYATFTVGSVTAWLKADTAETISFVDYHECHHDDPPAPCTLTTRWDRVA